MEWPGVVLDWVSYYINICYKCDNNDSIVVEQVNSLRLTENPINSIVDLGDGKFLCEILQLL
jgi:hypothetical protein